ncbi:hypothetical protein N7492_006127 [Penicillium capsulatum]|uniref:Uncharacterized protein n=1 Tax=Penicillium capsulatum TaxID=69766 RepID=A0A9W9I0Y4_9EURO|nr:hypothetical protein N7492_006127 [Penicillium capsulatum]
MKTNDSKNEMQDQVKTVIGDFGTAPLAGTPIADELPLTDAPETVLAMTLDAMTGEGGYHDIDTLSNSSWEERTSVLQKGGYNRYREQCATNLGGLAELVRDKYDGDLNNLMRRAHGKRENVRAMMKEIKGIGDLGVELFFDNVQSIWPSIAPFVDSRSLKTADEIGIGTDLDAIYGALREDPEEMSLLANGLSAIRLEKRQSDLQMHHVT